MRTTSHKGFIIPLAIAIVAVLVVGGVGIVVWKNSSRGGCPAQGCNGDLYTYQSTTTNQLITSSSTDSTSSQPSITVIFPNGDETLMTGQSYLIKWTTNKFNNNGVQISLRDSNDQTIGGMEHCLEGTTTYQWNIPSNFARGEYKIYIGPCDPWDYSNITPGLSDRYFIISSSTNPNSNWKTYINSKYGYEISYPNDATVTTAPENSIPESCVSIKYSSGYILIATPDSINVPCSETGVSDEDKKTGQSIIIGDATYEADGFSSNDANQYSEFLNINLPKNIYVTYGINQGPEIGYQGTERVIKEILSTFKFTN